MFITCGTFRRYRTRNIIRELRGKYWIYTCTHVHVHTCTCVHVHICTCMFCTCICMYI